ncbi:MAG: two-component hybrid sensor and regulator [Candidatus Ozemobacter sibiricus]|jgi:signal transduction histidine kinase|uniref:histidine kinase n=1 Tax=Candidatus Ozemobacter sibiricus TaxID=2268124 RepID=A0A367ZV85_9BACT|nr:MAG: two-component hybrid sensor and regulator [Candidatus Ozemobacter sibiricus]
MAAGRWVPALPGALTSTALVMMATAATAQEPGILPDSSLPGPSWAVPSLLGFLVGMTIIALRRRFGRRSPFDADIATAVRKCLSQVSVPVAGFDQDGRVHLWNASLEKLSGLSFDRVRGSLPAEIPAFGPDHQITQELQRFHAAPVGLSARLRTTIYSGARHQQVPVLVTLDRVAPGESPEFPGWTLVVFTDLSENEELRLQYQQAMADAQSSVRRLSEIDRLKSEFLAVCSHELKTPLVSITGYLDLLTSQKLGPLTPRQENALRVSLRNAGRLNELLGSLLDLARMEAGKMKFELTPHRLGPILEEILEVIHPMAETKHLTVEAPPLSGLPYVQVDPSMINRVFLNLLDNAIKFTPPGGSIRVQVTVEEEQVHVAIIDSGVGIPPGDLDRVTTPFFQSDASDTRPAGGLGLGLAIVEKILLGHATRLHLVSQPGQGTQASFSLRIVKKGQSGKTPASPAPTPTGS